MTFIVLTLAVAMTAALGAVVRHAKGTGAVLQPALLSKSAPSRPRLRR